MIPSPQVSTRPKIRRRQRCPECGPLDVIKRRVRNGSQRFKCGNLKSFQRGRPAICWLLPATPKSAAAELQYLIRVKSARSTEFPLRRLAVRGCERTMSEAKRRTSMKRSGTSEADFRTAATTKVDLSAMAVRWFLLPEAGLRRRQPERDPAGQSFVCEIHRLRRRGLNGAVRGAGVADGQESLPFCTPGRL